MNVIYPRLKSMLPPRSAAAKGSNVADPRTLQDWLDHLPLTKRSFSLMLLHGALREFNETLMAPPQRLAMLEMFERTASALADDARHEAREYFPMPAEHVDDAQVVIEVERDLALGYIAVVCDLCAPSGKAPLLRRGVVAKALMQACLHQSAQLWQAFRMHAEPAQGVWQGLHDLFRFSVKSSCADKENENMRDGAKTSSRSIYIQALLYAFAKPNQFTQAQNRQLHAGLPVLASWCSVKPGFAPAGAIAVHAAGDQSPPSPPRGEQVEPGDLWVLDISALLVQFDTLLADGGENGEISLVSRSGGARATLGADLVEVLKRVWSERIARGSPRSLGAAALLETEVGLSGLHFILSGNRDFESALPGSVEVSAAAANWALRAPDRAQGKRARAAVIDHSRRGYRLHWRAGEEARARVGELIALAPVARGEHQWHFGTLRWLRADVRAGVEAGVELLSSPPLAVAVYALDAVGVARAPVRGILIGSPSSDSSANSEACIFVSRPFARDAAALEVLRIDAGADPAVRPVRAARFAVRDAGPYQKIVLPDDVLARITAQTAASAARA